MADKTVDTKRVECTSETTSYVEVMYAKSHEEATGCRDLLEGQAIPARVEESANMPDISGVAVLVPDDRFIEASELLASQANGIADPSDDLDGSFDDRSDIDLNFDEGIDGDTDIDCDIEDEDEDEDGDGDLHEDLEDNADD